MRTQESRRDHICRIVQHCIRIGAAMPPMPEIAAEVGFRDGSSITKNLRALVAEGRLRYRRNGSGKIEGFATDEGSTRMSFGAGVRREKRRTRGVDAANTIKHRQTHDQWTVEAKRRGEEADAVLRDGRNLYCAPLPAWLVAMPEEEAA